MTYMRTQHAPIWLILIVLSVAAFIAAWSLRDQLPVALAVGSIGAAMLLLAWSFKTLTVTDEGDALVVRFGPLPLFRKRIPYAAIRRVESAHTALIDGWGIHFIPGRDWTWNIWGRSCVRLTANGRTIRIGSEEPERLVELIRAKINA